MRITLQRPAHPLPRAWHVFATVLVVGLLHQGSAFAQAPSMPLSGTIEEQAGSRMKTAHKLKEAGQIDQAMALLQQMIADQPQSVQVPNAYWLLGQILIEIKKPDEAVPYFKRLLEDYPDSALAPTARLALATALLATGQPDAALPLLLEAKSHSTETSALMTIQRHLEEAYLSKQDYMRAIESALEAGQLGSEEARHTIALHVRDLIASTVPEKDLRRLADKYARSFPSDIALLRLIEIYTAANEDHQVSRAAREFLGQFSQHAQADHVTALLTAQRKTLQSKTYRIGALLPLSGPLSAYGADVLNGVRLALEVVADTSPSFSVGLVTKDTAGDAKRLTHELDDLLKDYRPLAVIGPLLSRDVKAVASSADANEVVFITPTATLQDAQASGRYVFNAALNNHALIRDLAVYATDPPGKGMGWKRFCILASQDTYGAEMTRIFEEEILRLGGKIIASESYGLDDTDLATPIKRLKDADLKQQGRLEKIETSKKGARDQRYHPGFDAIFLPGDAKKVGLLAGQVRFYAAPSIGMLGTNGMHSPTLLTLDPRGVEGAIFADSFFGNSAEPAARSFAERYRKRFQMPPSSLSAQAFESATLILTAIHKGATTGRELRERLQATTNAPGLVGPLTMTAAGNLERRHAIIQVKHGKFTTATGTP